MWCGLSLEVFRYSYGGSKYVSLFSIHSDILSRRDQEQNLGHASKKHREKRNHPFVGILIRRFCQSTCQTMPRYNVVVPHCSRSSEAELHK